MTRRPLLNPFLHLAIMALAVGQAIAEDNAEARYSGVSRVVVFADVSGAYEDMASILRQTDIIDDEGNWSGGDSYLVSLGDIVDRGPASRAALDLLMSLQTQAGKAGGKVLLALGNHEVMNMIGDWRYVSEQEIAEFAGEETVAQRQAAYANYQRQRDQATLSSDQTRAEFDRQFPAGYFARLEAFSPQGKYGNWLLEQSVVLVVNDTLFVHGGLAPVIGEITTKAAIARFSRPGCNRQCDGPGSRRRC